MSEELLLDACLTEDDTGRWHLRDHTTSSLHGTRTFVVDHGSAPAWKALERRGLITGLALVTNRLRSFNLTEEGEHKLFLRLVALNHHCSPNAMHRAAELVMTGKKKSLLDYFK